MPEELIKARGGAKYWRTISLPNGKYVHLAITRYPGARGGYAVAGPVHEKLRS